MSVLAKLTASNAQSAQWRQHIHAHPETAFEEVDTAEYVATLLTSWGVKIHRGLAKTAVVGVIHGKTNTTNRSIGLRADMDALNIHEQTHVAHCSTHDGKMHACGHDGHTAMLLAAVKYLSETRDFDGTIYAVFQPAEEGGGGANVMIEEGFFKQFPCDAIFGMHNYPWLPAGTMAVAEGPVTASTDTFIVTVSGKGGHAAFPHTTIDVVATGAAIVTALQSLVSRNIDPLDSAVVSVCKFHAGTESLNVLPETVTLGGTARALKPATRKMLEQGIKRVVDSTAAAYGATAEVEWRVGYPSVINTPAETRMAQNAAAQIVGAENVSVFVPMMGGEDFAYFLEKCPGAYMILGQGKSLESPALHSPHYDFNDEVLPIGAAYWVKLAETILTLK
jgi:hippurate hydrolase